MGRAHEKWHICKCLVFHAENLLKVYTQKNSGYTKSRRKIRQQKIPKIDSKFLHIELLSREAWASKDTRFLTLSLSTEKQSIKQFPHWSPPLFMIPASPVGGQRKGIYVLHCHHTARHITCKHRLNIVKKQTKVFRRRGFSL